MHLNNTTYISYSLYNKTPWIYICWYQSIKFIVHKNVINFVNNNNNSKIIVLMNYAIGALDLGIVKECTKNVIDSSTLNI